MNILIDSIIVATVWFISAGILYMNPFVKKITFAQEKNAGVKKWNSQKEMLIQQLIFGVLIPSILFTYAYHFLRPAMANNPLTITIQYGLILIGLRVIPRLMDMAMLSSYPKSLLILDLINGSITSFIIAFTLSNL